MVDYSVVLDKNERERMLAEGYLPEVIDWHARERFNALQEEFRWKNAILKSRFTPVSFYEFVGDVFSDLEKFMVVTAEQGYREMDADELMNYQASRSDVYVVPASFINGYNSSVACKDVYALVVDIDKIDPETLKAIITNGNLGGMTPMPTYIVNSGRGVHFYYVFRQPVPHYYANQKILKDMYRKLCGITKKNILAKTDWHAITQPFRLPGSLTRLGQIVTGWQCDEKCDAAELARRLGVDCSELELRRRPLLSQEEYKKAKAKRAEQKTEDGKKTKKRKKGRMSDWKSSLEGKEAFYSYCLQRCYEETQEGSRYRSMCALVIVARKVVSIPKERVEQDLERLLVHYNSIGKHMRPSEVKKALRMYNDKAIVTTSRTLEQWFGWEFRRDASNRREKLKERGTYVKRTRREICERARKIRDIDFPDGSWINRCGRPLGSGTALSKVLQYRAEHPEARPKDCIQATGLSKNTVYKWWKIAIDEK